MIRLWFAGAVFAAGLVIAETVAVFLTLDGYSATVTVHLPELLTYIGAPMGCGIIGYLTKSAFENKEKIKQNYMPDYDQDINGG